MVTDSPWDHGQWAITKYYGNLSTGALKAYCVAVSSHSAKASVRAIYAEMKDPLSFHIPAGTYTDGLFATISGSLIGGFLAIGEAYSMGDFEATFGSATFVQKYNTPQTNLAVNMPFSLTTWIVKPNTIFTRDKTIPITFELAIGENGRFSASPAIRFNAATTHFYNTMQIDVLDTPGNRTEHRLQASS